MHVEVGICCEHAETTSDSVAQIVTKKMPIRKGKPYG